MDVRMEGIREISAEGDLPCAVVSLQKAQYLCLTAVASLTNVGLVASNAQDTAERMSLAHTRLGQGDLFLRPTSSLISNRRNILARVIEDDYRSHDIISGALFEDYGQRLSESLAGFGVPYHRVPDPVRLFCTIVIEDDGTLRREPGGAAPGDRLVLFASTNLLVGLVAIAGAVSIEVFDRMPSNLTSQ